jgi:PPK2 family polyphosphate:nucleotide phosphotransferase
MAKDVDLEARYRVHPGGVKLSDHDPGDRAGLDKAGSVTRRAHDLERLAELQERLYAESRRSLLVVFQAIDAAGKDGTIAHVMGGVNPQGVRVTSFKTPSPIELAHDWLWRCQLALPTRGEIGIFNRSHYEEVLVLRVHPKYLAGESVDPALGARPAFWRDRFRDIAAWERHLDRCGTRVVKLFLHVSKHEQRRRFLARADDEAKHWKFSASDVEERRHFDAYMKAYEAALGATSTKDAPWYVIPADHKWLMRTAAAAIIVHHLERLDPRYPEPDADARAAMAAAVASLRSEHDDG